MYLRDLTEEESKAMDNDPEFQKQLQESINRGKERQRRMKALEEIKPLDEIPHERLREILNAEDFPIESIRQELKKR